LDSRKKRILNELKVVSQGVNRSVRALASHTAYWALKHGPIVLVW